MYLTNVGKISTGLVVRHKCDNPNCINPEHLEIGTQADNIQDMVDRGRQATNIGEKNPKARLSTKNVIDIRKRFQNGERQIEIAKRYGITRHHVWDVINRKWKHINENALSKEAIKEIMKDKNTGENNPNAKLSVSDVIDIRNRYQNGEKQANIAQNYGCSKALISSVIRRKIWKQLPMEVPC
jgi:Mor family transcriptional regulator